MALSMKEFENQTTNQHVALSGYTKLFLPLVSFYLSSPDIHIRDYSFDQNMF